MSNEEQYKTIKEYNIPGIGKLSINYLEKQKIYYAGNDEMGTIASSMKTEEEARIIAGEEIKKILKRKKEELQKELKPINNSLESISLEPTKLNLLDSFEV